MTVVLGFCVELVLELDVGDGAAPVKLLWEAQAGADGFWSLDGLPASVSRDGNSSSSSSRRALGFGIGKERGSWGPEVATVGESERF